MVKESGPEFGSLAQPSTAEGGPYMRSDDSHAPPPLPDKLLDIYKDICNNIRVTDDISFKLLGIVPLASGVGSGALAILEKSKLLEGYSRLAVVGLSALGALITFGLFRWELRNIQKCSWLAHRSRRQL